MSDGAVRSALRCGNNRLGRSSSGLRTAVRPGMEETNITIVAAITPTADLTFFPSMYCNRALG
eukprot:3006130-Prymnesium_polylepis.1